MKSSHVLAAIIFAFFAILGAVIARGSQLSLLVLDALGIEISYVSQGNNLRVIRVLAGGVSIICLVCLTILCRRCAPNR